MPHVFLLRPPSTRLSLRCAPKRHIATKAQCREMENNIDSPTGLLKTDLKSLFRGQINALIQVKALSKQSNAYGLMSRMGLASQKFLFLQRMINTVLFQRINNNNMIQFLKPYSEVSAIPPVPLSKTPPKRTRHATPPNARHLHVAYLLDAHHHHLPHHIPS